jgi:hypothetical protein
VDWGESLRLAAPPTVALGIDPAPRSARCHFRTLTYVFAMTSSAFFQAHASFARGFMLAFVDGRHLFEHVLEDYLALEGCAGTGAVMALHDTIPLDEETSARERTTDFYTGDVWRMLPWLAEHRPQLQVMTVETAPSGLTLIRSGEEQTAAHSRVASDRAAIVEWLRSPIVRAG